MLVKVQNKYRTTCTFDVSERLEMCHCCCLRSEPNRSSLARCYMLLHDQWFYKNMSLFNKVIFSSLHNFGKLYTSYLNCIPPPLKWRQMWSAFGDIWKAHFLALRLLARPSCWQLTRKAVMTSRPTRSKRISVWEPKGTLNSRPSVRDRSTCACWTNSIPESVYFPITWNWA